MPFPVSFQTHVGSFTMPTTDQASSITGVGFQPRAIILFSAGNPSADAWQGKLTDADKTGMSVGMFAAGGEAGAEANDLGGCVYEAADDGVGAGIGPINCGLYQRVFRVRDSADVLMGEATLQSFDADGFTLNWTNVFGLAPIIGFIALGGEALLARVVKWRVPADIPGTQDVTVSGVGFEPTLVFHIFGSSSFSPTPWLDAAYTDPAYTAWRLGAMDGLGNQWAISFARDNATPTDSKRSLKTDRAMYGTEYQAYPAMEAAFLSMNADGFAMRAYNNTIETVVISLCLGGVRARIGTIAKPTSTQSQATSGIGFQPKGLILASVMAAVGETDGILAGVGAASSSSARRAISRVDTDNISSTFSQKWTDLDKVFYGPNSETTHADLTSFDADGWTLAWTTDSAGSFPVAYIALGAPERTPHSFDMELNGLGGGWTIVTQDVLLNERVALRYGISGTGPLDLVASTGSLKFVLNNSEFNSAGKRGFYSPRHANCRPGFQLGIRVRYSYLIPGGVDGYGKFIGRLRDIEPEPGKYRDRKTTCQAVDWMNEAAITKYNAPTQVNKRADEVLTTILALVPRQPDSTQFDVANSTFPYSLDNGPVERSTVITEIQRICQSEYGRAHVHGGLNYWGRLFFEKRTARLIPAPVAVFDGSMQDLDAGSGAGKVKNKAKVTAHPRRVDAAATTVLFAKPNQNNPQVAALAILKMSGRYVDPSNPNARVGGTDMVAPVATTDYLMNANADGSGADRTANFTVTAGPPYGANQADFVITNTHATLAAFVTKLQIRGRGLYDYDPLEAEDKNQASIDAIGESGVDLDMPYQSEITVAKAVAEFLIDTWSSHESLDADTVGGGSPGVTEASIGLTPRDADEITAAMALEPGNAITVREELSVTNDVYYIQSVGIQIDGDKVSFDFDLQRALVQSFWQLGTAGFGELGVTTVLAPL